MDQPDLAIATEERQVIDSAKCEGSSYDAG